MVAVPLLGGALLRLVLGLLTDHIGARRTGILGMALTTLPLLLGWLWADRFDKLLLVGLLLGVAGASFAAALPLASRWYPRAVSGAGHGDRRGREQRHRPGDVLRAPAGAGLGLARRLRPGHRTAAGNTGRFCVVRQGQPEPAGTTVAGGLRRRVADARHLVVLPVLLHHVRRVCRSGQLFERLLPQPVRAFAGPGGQFHHPLCRRRLVPPAIRRLSCRPPGRSADVDGRLHRRGRGDARAHVAAATRRRGRCSCSR